MTEIARLFDLWGGLIAAAALPLSLGFALWTWNDAGRLRRNGARVSRVLWSVLVLLVLPFALPGYVFLRDRVWKPQALDAGAAPEDLEAGSRSPSEEKQAVECSPERFRALIREHAGPSGEAFAAAREHYDRHFCADVLDVGRFEEIVAEEIERSRPNPHPTS